ncbi:lipopolysaccharide biosynthesis protein [Bacteroides sp. 519]|uniref:lipopolysaccharide biosynthesis protein n=1 Tax=Bacteroides sp. 519 TaxID=2302937 RepID=UPI0013D51562|nr:lipopolysaccharide biosynthesis protein [Bacteroides sp. 519]NDV60036.1 lipopolysaccharide biosynthesis protein [Bacteroides sp. 519]
MSGTLKEKTAKGLFWGGISNGVLQLLNLVFGVFLARILNANDYGMVGMLAIFSLLSSTIQESGLTAAIANKKEVSHNDYNAVFWFNIIIGSLLYIVLFLISPLIAVFYKIPELTSLARYSFLGFLISSFGVVQNSYFFRNLMIKQKSISLMVSLAISGIIGIVLAYNGFSYWGIATQNIVYITCVVSCYWYFSPWRPTFKLDFTPLKQMIGFSSKLLITNLFIHLNNNLFSILLGKFYTKADVGNYTQANKWNYMGYSLVSDTLHNVSQPVLAKINDDVLRQQNVFRKLLRFTSFIAFPVMLGISFVSYELIVITITEKWLPAVEILQLLCISGAFIPIIRLYSNLLISRGKSNVYMWCNITLCLSLLVSMLITHSFGMRAMFIGYVIINICWVLVWHYFLWKEIKISLLNALKDILPFLVITITSILISYFLLKEINNLYIRFVGKILLTAILYVIILWITRAKVFRESLTFLKQRTI